MPHCASIVGITIDDLFVFVTFLFFTLEPRAVNRSLITKERSCADIICLEYNGPNI